MTEQMRTRYQEAAARLEKIEQDRTFLRRYGSEGEVADLDRQLRFARKAVNAAREDYWASL